MTPFEDIYRRHYPQMYRLARLLLYDAQESKDVVSDVFLRLLHMLSDGRMTADEAKLEGYLMTAVRNRCRDVLAHKSVRQRVESLFLEDTTSSVDSSYDDRLEQLLMLLATSLPPLSLRIFRLRFLHDMTYEEVARSVGVSKVTVYNHLAHTLKFIRTHFHTDTPTTP